MDSIDKMKSMAGILNESKYGIKFDVFKHPFKNQDRKVVDNDGRPICECPNQDLAKELAAIMSDFRKLREICERIMSLPK